MSKHQDIVEKFRKRRSSRQVEEQITQNDGNVEFSADHSGPLVNGHCSIDEEPESHDLNGFEEVSSDFSSDVNVPVNDEYDKMFTAVSNDRGRFSAKHIINTRQFKPQIM